MKDYTVTITKKITDDDLINILCGATSTACSYWCSDLKYDAEKYKASKKCLIQAGNKEPEICYEDVILQMLKEGNSIVFYDAEDDEKHPMDFNKFLKGIEKYMSSKYVSSMDLEDWDDNDFDNVIQYALFDEIIFG